jgi:hypothetical protein
MHLSCCFKQHEHAANRQSGPQPHGHEEAEPGSDEQSHRAQAAPDDAALQAKAAQANAAAAQAIAGYIAAQKLTADALTVEFDGASGARLG